MLVLEHEFTKAGVAVGTKLWCLHQCLQQGKNGMKRIKL